VFLHECVCGEPIVDHQRRCPTCAAPNPSYRRSRWLIFWPEVDSVPGIDEAIQLGYWAAFLAAALGAVTSFIPGVGVGLAGLVDAALYAVCGVGIRRKWRSAAALAFIICVANILFSLSHGGGIGVLAIFIFVGLANGVRGTFAASRLEKSARATRPPNDAMPRTGGDVL
jgi:hypothetical protein